MIKELVEINYSKSFDRELKKAPLKIKIAFRKRLKLFLQNEYNPTLNNHSLLGKLLGFRSINITGDWRAIYSKEIRRKGEKIIIFEVLGTHSQLYK